MSHDSNVPVGLLGLSPKEAKRERQRRSALALRLQRAEAEAALAERPSGDWIIRRISVEWYDGTGEDFDRLADLVARVEAIAARHR